jgi:thiol-disulfide isomerase/thioredoxin
MAATASSPVPVGTPMPRFDLPTVHDARVASADLDADVLVVMFLCNHCPYVRHVEDEIARVAEEYADDPVAFVAICSNDATSHPDDAPPRLAEQAERAGWPFPYAVDETQDVARAFRAACTPDFFVYDRDRTLAYRGALDGASPGNDVAPSGADLRRAVDRTLEGREVPEPHRPPLGCSIKWRGGG